MSNCVYDDGYNTFNKQAKYKFVKSASYQDYADDECVQDALNWEFLPEIRKPKIDLKEPKYQIQQYRKTHVVDNKYVKGHFAKISKVKYSRKRLEKSCISRIQHGDVFKVKRVSAK